MEKLRNVPSRNQIAMSTITNDRAKDKGAVRSNFSSSQADGFGVTPKIMQRDSQWTRKLLTTNRGLKYHR